MSQLNSLIEKFQLTDGDCSKPICDIYLEKLSRAHCDKWRFLPPYLGLESTIKDDINRKPVDEREKRYDFLIQWKKIKGAEATYKALINGLLEIECRSDAEYVCQLLQQPPTELTPSISKPSSTSFTQWTSAAGQSSLTPTQTISAAPQPVLSDPTPLSSVTTQPANTVPTHATSSATRLSIQSTSAALSPLPTGGAAQFAHVPGLCGVAGVHPKVIALKRNEEVIVDSLENANLEHLCWEAVEIGVVPQNVKKDLDSMDWENVPHPRVIRYLLMHVYRSIEKDSRLYERWTELLRKHVSSNDHVLDRSVILERHIPTLTKLLAGSAHKWKSVSLALGLPESVQDDLQMQQASNLYCFNHLLIKWVLGGYEHAKAPTLANLAKALQSIVGLEAEANNLWVSQWMFSEQPAKKECHVEPLLEIVRQSFDTVVPEGKSTLLEVQVAISQDSDVHYQWLKDGYQLSNESHNNILCVSYSSVSSKGTYKCEVTLHNGSDTTESQSSRSKARHRGAFTSSKYTVASRPIDVVVNLSFITKQLVDKYLSESEIPEDSWPPTSSNTYINLALIKQGHIDKAGEYARNTIQGNMDDILADKTSIEYENAFSDLESLTRLLIEGRPGSGKTTLVHKFSQDWARGSPQLNLHNIRRLFVVHLRGFFNNQYVKLRDIIELYYAEEPMVNGITRKVEADNGEGFCFILDGLDEYCPPSISNTYIYKLIKRQLLSKAVVIIASRPAASSQFRNIVSKQIEVVGFMNQQIIDYIENYPFSEAGKAGNLHKYLLHHPNVHHMCYLPIHAAMVCYMFDIMGSTLPRTETEMYEAFTNLTLLRTLKRDEDIICELEDYQSVEDLPDHDKELFLKICELSYTKTLSSKQAMRRNEVKNFFRDVNSGRESLGLITVDRMAKIYGFENLYTFLHLTFQEYLAAYHLKRMDEEGQKLELDEHGGKKHMQVVWKFYCGLVHFSDNDARFGEIMQCSGVNEDSLFGVQCAFESQQTVPCDYVVVQSGECGTLFFKEQFLTPSDLTAIGYVLRHATCPVEKLVLDRCKLSLEGVNAFLAEAGEKISSVKTLCFHGKHCEIEQYQMLNICLKKITSIETLDLSEIDLDNRNVKVLTDEVTLPNLRSLKLLSPPTHLDNESARLLGFNCPQLRIVFNDRFNVSFIQWWLFDTFSLSLTFLSSVQELTAQLNLQYYKLQVAEVKLIAESLKEQASFTSLNLTNCCIGDDGCEALCNGLLYCSDLKELSLTRNSISDNGAIELSKALQKLTQLESLDISNNSIGAAGIAALADTIVQCTHLQKLDVSYNSIGDVGITSLANALRYLTRVNELNLASTKISDGGVISLTEVIKHCDKVVEDEGVLPPNGYAGLCNLVLSYNHIGDVGAKCLAESLTHCKDLKVLDLSYNKVGDEGAIAITRAISHLKGLKLRIWNHRISKEGSKYITGVMQDIDRNFHHLIVSSTMLKEIDILLNNMQDNKMQFNHIKEIKLNVNNCDIFQNQALSAIIKHCTELETLDTTLFNVDLATSSAHSSLTQILLNCTKLKVHMEQWYNFEYLARTLAFCYKLKTLDFRESNFSVVGARAIAASLQYCRNVQTLNLESSYISTRGVEAFAMGLQHCNSLKALHLGNNSISDDGAKALAVCLQQCSNLQILNLDYNQIGVDGIKALAVALEHCSSLQTLNLESNCIGDDGVKALTVGLQHCCSLKTLYLGNNSISGEGVRSLAMCMQRCSRLQILNLDYNQFDVCCVRALSVGLQHCRSLQMLNLESSCIGFDGVKALTLILQYSSLETLNLGENSIRAGGAKSLAVHLRHFTNLQTLNLKGNSIGDDGIKALAVSLQHCTTLQTLNLDCNEISVEGVNSLATILKHCNNLKILNLARNSIGCDGVKLLALGLQHCSSLEILNLGLNGISSYGVEALVVSLQHCCSLQTLNLDYNDIGTDGAKALAMGLQHCGTLKTLNLRHSSISDDCAKTLAMCLQHCRSLQRLDLESNDIGSDGVKALAVGLQHCSNLQMLQMRSNEIGAVGARALAVGLQHCSSLQILNLDRNSISGDGAKALAVGLQHCSSLQTLHLRNNNISVDCAKALTNILSNCKIYH